MKLIFIYGPPAAGKTTIGRKLATCTGFRFFPNQLTVSAVDPLFPDYREVPRRDQARRDLLKTMRLAALTVAAEQGVDVVCTLAYSGAVDDEFVGKIVQAVATNGGDVHFVQLEPPDATLLRRVTNLSRRRAGKIATRERLRESLATRDMRASVKYPNVLHLDTSKMKPAAAVQRITETFGLQIS